MKRDFFRSGDRVTIENYIGRATSGSFRGRVVCANRKSKYDMTIVVLVDDGETEVLETFRADGGSYMKESTCRITLGWSNER